MIQKRTYNLLVIDEDNSVFIVIKELWEKTDHLKCLHVNSIAAVVHALLDNQVDAIILGQGFCNIPAYQ